MNNTNFQTIHQMGQAINAVVKQATGRDAVQNIDMDYVTVAQNKHYEETSVSGRMVSFTTKTGGLPLEKCIVQIELVQEGSGNPSPDNIRPITGWTGVRIVVSPTTDEADGQTYSIAFPAEAGMVYGGKLNVITGELKVDKAIAQFDGSSDEQWYWHPSRLVYSLVKNGLKTDAVTQFDMLTLCDKLQPSSWAERENKDKSCGMFFGASYIFIKNTDTITSADTAKTWLASNPITVIYPLANPLTYQLTPQEIRTLTGLNNIWADTGNIEVTYKDLKELY